MYRMLAADVFVCIRSAFYRETNILFLLLSVSFSSLQKSNPYSSTVSAEFTSSAGRRMTVSRDDFDMTCQDVVAELWAYVDYILKNYVGFRELNETDFCHKKFQNVHKFVSDASSGACNVEIIRLWKARGRNKDEATIEDHFDDLIQEFAGAAGFTLTPLMLLTR